METLAAAGNAGHLIPMNFILLSQCVVFLAASLFPVTTLPRGMASASISSRHGIEILLHRLP